MREMKDLAARYPAAAEPGGWIYDLELRGESPSVKKQVQGAARAASLRRLELELMQDEVDHLQQGIGGQPAASRDSRRPEIEALTREADQVMRSIRGTGGGLHRKSSGTAPTISKSFQLKAGDVSLDANGRLVGAPSVLGVIDQGGDVIFPGFFTPALAEFTLNGFIPVGHKWDELPVAMPTKAEERGNKLYSEAIFHGTQAGQDARTVARERLAQGLNMGLSVGFSTTEDGDMLFATGKLLLDHAKRLGCDMKLFDEKGIGACKSMLRGFLPGGCDTLFEWSIVPAPMNKQAGATEAKGRYA
jgi:hypothetical protein